jgi:hypothetical protein
MSATPYIELSQKRDITQVINTAFSLLRQIYKRMFRDILLITGPFFLLSGIFSALANYNEFGKMHNNFERLNSANPFAIFESPEIYMSLFASLMGWSLALCVCGNHIRQYFLAKNKEYDVQEVRKTLGRDFWRVLVMHIILFIIVAGGAVCLAIPGIYLGVANSLAVTILVQNKGMNLGSAMSESRRLIHDNWWRSLGLGVLVVLFEGVKGGIFTIILGIFSVVIQLHSAQGGNIEEYKIGYIITTCVPQLINAILTPVSISISAVYYYSLKEEKDQTDLARRIDEIGMDQPKTIQNEGGY